MTSAVRPCHPSNSHLCHKHCVCVCVYLCVAILHESDAAGLLCAAEVDVKGQRRKDKYKKMNKL